MRMFIPVTVCLFAIGTGQAADPDKAAPRNWSDNTGTFRISATLVDFDPDSTNVRLKLGSGKTIDLSIRRLSAADQNYVSSRISPPAKTNKRPLSQNVGGIDWIQTREDASRVALGGKSVKDDKPIMCFRALGDLQGFM